mmetsp:Transcript_23374/g.34772  ORF Transcript_23374/g.34772 Transcript_23374/m.34772 type:complete len:307 (-) Transcript_23374:71-991(-)
MQDLEESILQKNIPGKYSTWSEYREDGIRPWSTCDVNDDDDEDGKHDQFQSDQFRNKAEDLQGVSAEAAQFSRNRHHTGVKGILADHREAKELERLKYAAEQKQKEDAFRRATEGSRLNPGEVSLSIASIEKRMILEKAKHHRDESDESSSSDSDDSYNDDDENDSFLDNYRRLRLTQLQNSALPVYDRVEELGSAVEFSDVIDDTDSRIFCIFHLFENNIRSCQLLNQYLDALSQKMRQCRFFKMKASVVKHNFDPIGYPCVLIYKGGNEVANLTPITSFFTKPSRQDQFSLEDVESVLNSQCIL